MLLHDGRILSMYDIIMLGVLFSDRIEQENVHGICTNSSHKKERNKICRS